MTGATSEVVERAEPCRNGGVTGSPLLEAAFHVKQ